MDRRALFARIHELAGARLAGRETPEQAAELARLLADSREARRLYLAYVSDSVSLHLRAHAAAVARADGPAPRARRWSLWSVRLAWSTAFVLLLALGGALWRGRDRHATYAGVAVLARTVDAEWQGAARQPGAVLPAGPLRLARGFAQVELFGGATLVVEGPADLDLVSASAVYVRRGKVRASVPPPARGFVINGPGLEVIDHGTEFGVAVGPEGSELHVFDGEVELRPRGGPERLTTGQRAAVDPAGERRKLEAATSFTDRPGLARLADDDLRRRHARWRAHSDRIRQDPSTVVYFTFEEQEPWDRTLVNQAAPSGGAAHAAIVGCRFATGRWPLKKALEFKRPGDRVRLEVPGRFDSLSFAAWVKFDGFDRQWNSLFLTDDWDPGEPHWQVSREGEVILGVSGPGNHFSPPVLSAHDLGRWVHLATVYDRATLTVTHYVDGRVVGTRPIRSYLPLVIGAAEIGNWGLPMGRAEHQIRNLNGAIDELAVLGRSLSADEVAAMYEAGRPE